MRRMLLAVVGVALVCMMATSANAGPNHNGKFALHVAGLHDEKVNTCDFVMTDCATQMVTEAAPGVRYDIYAMALDVTDVTAARYGLYCEVPVGTGFWFYGWTSCSDLELPTGGWPGCGEGNAQSWATALAGPHVTMGILDVFVYGDVVGAKMAMGDDPRTGFAEFCDGTEPSPLCDRVREPAAFGSVGFLRHGYNPCSEVPAESSTWGVVKSLYR